MLTHYIVGRFIHKNEFIHSIVCRKVIPFHRRFQWFQIWFHSNLEWNPQMYNFSWKRIPGLYDSEANCWWVAPQPQALKAQASKDLQTWEVGSQCFELLAHSPGAEGELDPWKPWLNQKPHNLEAGAVRVFRLSASCLPSGKVWRSLGA